MGLEDANYLKKKKKKKKIYIYIYIPPLHAAPPLKHAPDLGPKLQEVVSWGPEN